MCHERRYLPQRALCHKRLVCSAADKDRHGALCQIGLLSLHDALGAEDFVH